MDLRRRPPRPLTLPLAARETAAPADVTVETSTSPTRSWRWPHPVALDPDLLFAAVPQASLVPVDIVGNDRFIQRQQTDK
jgi:hypothetical protein